MLNHSPIRHTEDLKICPLFKSWIKDQQKLFISTVRFSAQSPTTSMHPGWDTIVQIGGLLWMAGSLGSNGSDQRFLHYPEAICKGNSSGIYPGTYLTTFIYHMGDEMEHTFTDFLEDTKLKCAGDLCEGCTQRCCQTRDHERATVVL